MSLEPDRPVRSSSWCRSFGMVSFALLFLAQLSPAVEPLSITPLPESLVIRLPKAAQKAYNEAMEDLDHINYERAFEDITIAVKEAPESFELRQIAISLALYRSRMLHGSDANTMVEIAVINNKAILKIERLSRSQRAWAKYMERKLDAEGKLVERRDETRRNYGLELAKQYAREIYTKNNESQEIRKFQDSMRILKEQREANKDSSK